MLRITVHIPEETKQRIDMASRAKRKVESEIVREALDKGLDIIYPRTSSAQALLDLAKLAKKVPTKGKVPKDAVENMDFYTWGGEKRD